MGSNLKSLCVLSFRQNDKKHAVVARLLHDLQSVARRPGGGQYTRHYGGWHYKRRFSRHNEIDVFYELLYPIAGRSHFIYKSAESPTRTDTPLGEPRKRRPPEAHTHAQYIYTRCSTSA